MYAGNKYVIAYDGNIYNTKELKALLEESGFEINTRLDEELLIKGYIHYGKDVAKHLNGVFAFAIWDEKKRFLMRLKSR